MSISNEIEKVDSVSDVSVLDCIKGFVLVNESDFVNKNEPENANNMPKN